MGGLRRLVVLVATGVPLLTACTSERPGDRAGTAPTTEVRAPSTTEDGTIEEDTPADDTAADDTAAVPEDGVTETVSSGVTGAAPTDAGDDGADDDDAAGDDAGDDGDAAEDDAADDAAGDVALSSCVVEVAEALTPRQRAGQLVMAAVPTGWSAAAMEPYLVDHHVGNVLYLGGWEVGVDHIAATSSAMQAHRDGATAGIGLIVAADQEGGVVQQLQGPGFSQIPSALTQASWAREDLVAAATAWGRELAAAGVNLNLAPVQEVVPAELGRGNGPVGQWGRQYGHDPDAVEAGSVAFLEGMHEAGVATSIKHFPGIGRLRGNPDHTADGLVDDVLTADDPYLEPFAAGIEAGASTVMVGSATYPNLDPERPAMFSPAVVDGLLREDLGYQGVVVSDDINAVAVRHIAATSRATRFIGAGGDIVLTGDTRSTPQLVEAIMTKTEEEDWFARRVDTSLGRVLTLKESMGLLPCEP